MDNEFNITIFPVRHLSPRASHELLTLCGALCPDCILIEAPSDAAELLRALVGPDILPPVAVLAYTSETLTRSYTLPLAGYSPEYAAVRWALEHGAAMECVDLPFSAALAFPPPPLEQNGPSAYDLCAQAAGETDFDTYFETYFEHGEDYRAAALAFGETLRKLSPPDGYTFTRERHMRRRVRDAEARGYQNIILVCGAYHAPALLGGGGTSASESMTDMEIEGLPYVECALTLIPYAYPKLVARSGYGAGHNSPGYNELLWKHRHDRSAVPAVFLSAVAAHLKEVSAASVADAVVLAQTLASMRGRPVVLEDLRSAAVTVLGRGDGEVVADALNAVEIGAKTGSVPSSQWRAPPQDDFHRQIQALKLTRFLTDRGDELILDLREGLARRRSVFLHRLRALEVPLAVPGPAPRAVWKEVWTFHHTPETEIALAEAVTYGVTVEAAAAGALEAALAEVADISGAAEIVGQALRCDLPALFAAACGALRDGLGRSDDFIGTVRAADALDRAMQCGMSAPESTRDALMPLLQRLCLRACLSLPTQSRCGGERAAPMAVCIQTLNRLFDTYAMALDAAHWREAVAALAGSTEANPRLSGLAFALRLERGEENADALSSEIYRRLSPAFPIRYAADWLDGLASRNRRALLETPGLWERLDEAVAGLDEERFHRALVPLRRMFSRFSGQDRRQIADRLAAHWGAERPPWADPDGVRTAGSRTAGSREVSQEEQEILDELRGLEIF